MGTFTLIAQKSWNHLQWKECFILPNLYFKIPNFTMMSFIEGPMGLLSTPKEQAAFESTYKCILLISLLSLANLWAVYHLDQNQPVTWFFFFPDYTTGDVDVCLVYLRHLAVAIWFTCLLFMWATVSFAFFLGPFFLECPFPHIQINMSFHIVLVGASIVKIYHGHSYSYNTKHFIELIHLQIQRFSP